MLFANMGLTFAVVFLAKDTKASGAGERTTLEGSAIRTNGVAAHGVLWDLPAIDGVYLAKLETVTVDATLSSAAAGSVWPPTVQATFGVASAIKPTAGGVVSTTEAFLTLVGGGLVYINRGTQGGYLTTTDGSNFTLGGTMRNATTGVQPSRQLHSMRRFLRDGVDEHDGAGRRRLLFSEHELSGGRRSLQDADFMGTMALAIDFSTVSDFTIPVGDAAIFTKGDSIDGGDDTSSFGATSTDSLSAFAPEDTGTSEVEDDEVEDD